MWLFALRRTRSIQMTLTVTQGIPLTLRQPQFTAEYELRFQPLTQRGDHLCWAACVESVLWSMSATRTNQSLLARQFLPSCRVVLPVRDLQGSRCDEPLQATMMSTVWSQVGCEDPQKEMIGESLSARLVSELSNGSPVQAWVNNYHAVMLYGYRRKEYGTESVLVMDPQRGYGDYWRALDVSRHWSAIWTGLSLGAHSNA